MNYKFVLIFALLVNFSVSEETADECKDDEQNEEGDDDNIFIPTREWQTVKKGKRKKPAIDVRCMHVA